MSGFLPPLREAVNVEDLMERDKLVRRLRKIRAGAVLDKHTYEQINRTRPDLPPIETSFEDAIIAWCDGEGPMPTKCVHCAMEQTDSFVIDGICSNPTCPRRSK